MKSLITGSSGFIGKYLIERLGQLDHQVICAPYEELLYRAYEPVDYIFHLASYGNHSHQDDNSEIFKANVECLWRVLTLNKYKTFINFSTSSVLLPTQTMYSTTKMMGELLCGLIGKGKSIVTVRPYSVYGAGEADFRFIPTVIKSCLTREEMTLDPNATHDWIHVSDLIDAVILIANKASKYKGQVFDIGNGEKKTNAQILLMIEDLMGKQANVSETKKLRDYDTEHWIADTTKINKLGWEPQVSLREGLKGVIKYEKQRLEEENS